MLIMKGGRPLFTFPYFGGTEKFKPYHADGTAKRESLRKSGMLSERAFPIYKIYKHLFVVASGKFLSVGSG